MKPTTSNARSSAMIAVVKIRMPTGSFRCPPSANTFATRPRLEIDSMPAMANAVVKLNPRPKSKKISDVIVRAAKRDMRTEIVAATKNRPLMVDTKLLMSISSKPIMKKRMKTPTLRNRCCSPLGWTSFVTGPSKMPVAVYAMIELRPMRLKMPSASFATTMSSPMDRRASRNIN